MGEQDGKQQGNAAQSAARGEPPAQLKEYLQSLYKLVPTEVSAAYLVIYSVLDPIDSLDDATQAWLVGALLAAIVVLAVVNYMFFPAIRKFDGRDVRIFSTLTFAVWVLGTSVDLWTALLQEAGLNVPHAIFLVFVILWAVIAAVLLRQINVRTLEA